MELTNERVSNCVQQHAWDHSLSVHPLSMLLSGIVDPAVMGGFSNYEKVSPAPESHRTDRLPSVSCSTLLSEWARIVPGLTLPCEASVKECQALVPLVDGPAVLTSGRKTAQGAPKAQDVLPGKPFLGKAEMLYVE